MNRNFLKEGGVWVFREYFEKYHGTFSYFIRGDENFSEKGGGGGLVGKF